CNQPKGTRTTPWQPEQRHGDRLAAAAEGVHVAPGRAMFPTIHSQAMESDVLSTLRGHPQAAPTPSRAGSKRYTSNGRRRLAGRAGCTPRGRNMDLRCAASRVPPYVRQWVRSTSGWAKSIV